VLENILDVGDRGLLVDELAKLEVGEETLELVTDGGALDAGETARRLDGLERLLDLRAYASRLPCLARATRYSSSNSVDSDLRAAPVAAGPETLRTSRRELAGRPGTMPG